MSLGQHQKRWNWNQIHWPHQEAEKCQNTGSGDGNGADAFMHALCKSCAHMKSSAWQHGTLTLFIVCSPLKPPKPDDELMLDDQGALSRNQVTILGPDHRNGQDQEWGSLEAPSQVSHRDTLAYIRTRDQAACWLFSWLTLRTSAPYPHSSFLIILASYRSFQLYLPDSQPLRISRFQSVPGTPEA
jgi:hypothetical protein